MKAKEYAKKYHDAPEREIALIEIARMFVLEIAEMVELRNVKFDRGLMPIIKELDQKWKKFAMIINTEYFPQTRPIKNDGFLELLKLCSIEAYQAYYYYLKTK